MFLAQAEPHGAALPPSPPAEEDNEPIASGRTSGGRGLVAVGMLDGMEHLPCVAHLRSFFHGADEELPADLLLLKAQLDALHEAREDEEEAGTTANESQVATHGAALPSSPPAEEDGEPRDVPGQTSGGLVLVAN